MGEGWGVEARLFSDLAALDRNFFLAMVMKPSSEVETEAAWGARVGEGAVEDAVAPA